MAMQSAVQTGARLSQAISSESKVLPRILESRVNLSLWQRLPNLAIRHELTVLKPDSLPDMKFRIIESSFAKDIEAFLNHHGLEPQCFQNLITDLDLLVHQFAKLSRGRDLSFRFFTTNHDDCKRFHLDRVNLRLMCTYQGTGTEWLSEEQLDRDAQRLGAPNEEIVRFGEPQRFETFWVGIMKGDPKNVGQGLVHRSPIVSGTGQTRVVFSLDS